MTRKYNNDVVEMVALFQKKILENKPALQQMLEEVRMMKFKIKPLHGDISLLNLKNNSFIEILWSLGKLDEFFQSQYKRVSSGKKDLFLRLFDEIHEKFQDKLNDLNLKPEKVVESSSSFEMEIYKERTKDLN